MEREMRWRSPNTKSRLKRLIPAALLAFLLVVPRPAFGQPGFFFQYGQSAGVWKILSDVKGASGNLSLINDILNKNYGNYETAFARLGSEMDILHPQPTYLHTVGLGISLEAAGLGLIQNPVVPELQAAALAVALMRLSTKGDLGARWALETALVGGWGIERRLSAVSTDLIERIPFQKENVRLFGFDLGLRKAWKIENGWWLAGVAWKATFYKGLSGQTSVALDRKLRNDTHAWEGRLDYSKNRWNLHGILGSHPLPIDLLPRVWDRAANSAPWRELGAMSGAGITRRWLLGSASSLDALGGFYAGYLGGVLTWSLSQASKVQLATFGIENSSAYRTLGRRVYSLSAFFGF